MPKRPLPPPVPPWPPFRIDPLPLHALFDAGCPWCSLNRPGNALIRYIWPGQIIIVIIEPKPMATPETSHTVAIDPLTPQPSQPTPSPRLRQRRVRLVLMKLNGKCPIFDTFGQVILKSFFKLALMLSHRLCNPPLLKR